MFRRILLPLSIAAISFVACNKTAKSAAQANDKKEVSEEAAYAKFKTSEGDNKHFGETIDAAGAISYDDALVRLEKEKGLSGVKVKGEVTAVCQAKGCWMRMKSEAGKPDMFIKFKDYAFFMPKDLAGQKVAMLGDMYIETTSIEQLKHFAEDAGKSAEEIAKITKPKQEYKFMARGVVILN